MTDRVGYFVSAILLAVVTTSCAAKGEDKDSRWRSESRDKLNALQVALAVHANGLREFTPPAITSADG